VSDGRVGDAGTVLDEVWRADAAGMLGVLARRLGDLDRAEEALQDAVAEALNRWPGDGVPDSPAGWLVTTAWRKAVDRLRREATGRDKLAALASTPPPEPSGLVALLELHEARSGTRFDADGRLVLLEHQDRSRWDQTLIHTAVRRLARAAGHDRPVPYQLEAAIAAQHAVAPSYERTDWVALRNLYDHLRIMRPSPVVLLGRAVATSYVDGPAGRAGRGG
jgi:predicted RNA polymerase sigma factor